MDGGRMTIGEQDVPGESTRLNWKDISARAEELGLKDVPMNTLTGIDSPLSVLEFYDYGLQIASTLSLISKAIGYFQTGDIKEAIAALDEATNDTGTFMDDIHTHATGVVMRALDVTAAETKLGEEE